MSSMAPENKPGIAMDADVALKTFLSGGIAGCCAKTTVAPLDRVKILLQAHSIHYKHLGVVSTLQKVVAKEGYQGLFKGNGVQMIRIFPYASIQFTSYEQYKKIIKGSGYVEHPHMVKLVSGSLAGLTAIALTYPLDVIRARLAFQVKGEHVYLGLVDAIKTMVHIEGGTRAFYRGIVPSMLGMAPYAGLSFYTFETLKNLCLEYFPDQLGKSASMTTGGLVLVLPAKLLCGGLAGATAQTISYPLDVVRRRMQLSRMLPDAHRYEQGWLSTLTHVYQVDGLQRGLYRGLSINYLRAMPMVAVSFTVYESTKQLLGLDTGADR